MSITSPGPVRDKRDARESFPNPRPFRTTDVASLVVVMVILIGAGGFWVVRLAPAFSALQSPQEVQRLNALREEAEAAATQAQTAAGESARRRQSLAEEVATLEQRRGDLRAEVAGLEGKLEQARKDLEEIQAGKAKVDAEVASLRDQTSLAIAERDARQDELSRVQARLEPARKALENLDTERARLAQEGIERLQSLTTLTQQAEERVQALRSELEKQPQKP